MPSRRRPGSLVVIVVVVDEVGESRKELSDCRDGWRRILVAAQV